jgi:glycosyltransferase involved in cell wall biosynthesis
MLQIPKSVLIVGPFATEYSLAKVNRALALALTESEPESKIGVWGTAETIDRLPGTEEYRRYPFLKELFKNGSELAGQPGGADVVIYNNFPKNSSGKLGLAELPGKVKLAFLAWEESVYPQRWVEECNEQLHGIMVTSNHVKKIFKRCGIRIHMTVIPEGLDIPFVTSEPHPLKTKKHFKFLHISSGQYRKGVDVLLKAYFAEFTGQDDVCLVLKLYPNASLAKEISALIATRPEHGPELEIINSAEISDGYLKYLYEQSNAVVLPSRAEGFGLPMAEALELGKPLITTGYSGHRDFCNDSNAFLVDFKLVTSESHLNVTGAKVAEPDPVSLRSRMRFVYEHEHAPEVLEKIAVGKQTARDLTWGNSAKAVTDFLGKIAQTADLKELKMAVFSTYNSICGVANYSKDLYGGIAGSFKDFKVYANSDIGDRTAADEDFVERVWQYAEMRMDRAETALKEFRPDLVHIQYNLSFYSPAVLGKLILICKALKIQTYLTVHAFHQSFKDIIPELNQCAKVFSHSRTDLENLSKMGVKTGVLAIHGLNLYQDIPASELRNRIGLDPEKSPVLATHGMIHDKKGFAELIQACSLLKKKFPNLLLLAATAVNPNNSTSAGVYEQMQDLVVQEGLENNVIIFKEYLGYPEVIRILQLSDLIILPYGEVNEGASGAVNTCISAERPLIISQSHIFDELPVGYRIADNRPETIAAGISHLLDSKPELSALTKQITDYALGNTWEKIALAYLLMLASSRK